MKLKKLKINKLHNLFNYDINFFENINVWFGKNGCGKTTLLNIIDYIISGKIYKLFEYEFKMILLEYMNDEKESETISIHYNEEKKLVLKYNDEEEVIERLELNEERYYERNDEKDKYLEKYSILARIKNDFNIVYLPLTREVKDFDDEHLTRRMRMLRFDRGKRSYLDIALDKVQILIADTFAKVNEEISLIESKLKSEIFEIMFGNDLKKSNRDEECEFLEQDKEFIISNLKKFNFYNLNLEKQIELFSSRYNRIYKKYTRLEKKYEKIKDNVFNDEITKNYKNEIKVLKDLLNTRNELNSYNIIKRQVEGLRLKFEEYNERIREIMLPIDQFEEIVNSFLINSAVPKQIHVAYRKLYFTINKNGENFDISELSSGEKHIVAMIAHFIFKVLPEKQPIFIVDEPEMSLHLMWQRKWISSIESLNPSIQLIIATHSPEIVGKYRENMVNIMPGIEE